MLTEDVRHALIHTETQCQNTNFSEMGFPISEIQMMTDFQKRIARLVAALPDGDKHGRYARFCKDVERVTGVRLAKSYLSNWLTGYQVPGPFWRGIIDQYERDK